MSQEAFRIVPDNSFVKKLVIDLDEAVAIIVMDINQGLKKYTYDIDKGSE